MDDGRAPGISSDEPTPAAQPAAGAISDTERRLRAIVDNVDAVLFAMNTEAIFTLSRGKGLVRLGLAPDQVVGVDSRELYAEHPPIVAGIDAALAGTASRVVEQVGDTVFDISFAPDIDASGTIVGLVGVGYDITETTRIADDLARINVELAEATQAKNAFLTAMSHELRTPLNSIIGFSGLLLQGHVGPLTQEQQTQIGMIQVSGRHLLSLIEEVLDLSKIGSGKVDVVITPFDAADVVSEVAEILAPLAREKSLELRVSVPEGNCRLVSDSGKVKQILLNLAGNAIKFTSEGWVEIGLRCGAGGRCEFTVTDTGPGIPPESLGGVFEPFAQAEYPGVTRPEGTGLGLAISRDYAALLGGEISVTSVVGRGSAFSLSL